MPTFLKSAHSLDRFKCDCCGKIVPKALIHEHHVIKRASGGGDTLDNIVRLDVTCHSAVHQVEMALKNPKRRSTVTDLINSLFPKNVVAQKKCLELAATAALENNGKNDNNELDYGAFDTEELVTLTPIKVSPKIKQYVHRIAQDLRHPETGKRLGVARYLRGLIEADLKKRGYKI